MEVSKYIVVTGANSGIGYEITKYIAARGYLIIGTARRKSDLQRLESIKNVTSHYLDITQPESIEKFSRFIDKRKIQIFGLINNAGIIILGSTFLLKQEQIRKIFHTNVYGIMNLTNSLLHNLIKSRGRIINISSDSGLTVYPSSTVYCMTKHALEAFSEGIRSELKPLGVRVSLIEPGFHKSQIIENFLKIPESDDKVKFNEFEENHNKIIEHAKEWGTTEARDPIIVAKSVYECLQEEYPKLRYLVVSQSEHSTVINEIFDKLTEINNTNDYSFSLDELINKLKFAFDATIS